MSYIIMSTSDLSFHKLFLVFCCFFGGRGGNNYLKMDVIRYFDTLIKIRILKLNDAGDDYI